MRWFSDNPQVRKWIYGIALTVVPLFSAYGLVSQELAPLMGVPGVSGVGAFFGAGEYAGCWL